MSRADQCKIVLPGTRLRGGGKRQKNRISASQAVACGGGKGGGTCWRHTFEAAVHALIGQMSSR